tara:strand:+ start:2478 stop:3044 length:567 start_codon:yes stop_codon:yes gene_type:complete
MTKKEVKFEKQLVFFHKQGYEIALKHSKDKMVLLTNCIAWIGKHIKNYKIEEFQKDMVPYFLDKLGKEKKEFAQLKIRPEKVADLLDIDITELSRLEHLYNNAKGLIKFENGVVKENVDIEDYKSYTENEEQNKELSCAKKFIEGVKELAKVRQVYHTPITQVSRGLLNYDIYTNEYFYNKPVVRQVG